MSEVASVLLRDIARKIQLPPSLHRVAEERYGVIHDWLRREGSPLRQFVGDMYPQGSMMIGASISSKVDSDEFDLDLVLELVSADVNNPPRKILDSLYGAIRGEPGSRYFGMTRRRSRCVTIDYEGMHLDVTPAIRLIGPERESRIFHSNIERGEEYYCVANPWGFGNWFVERTPKESAPVFAEDMRKMAYPVPEHEPVEDKSLAVISLQLIKRWRNILYDGADRKPPSVMLAKLVADAATGRSGSLYNELMRQVDYIYSAIMAAHRAGVIVSVTNPVCQNDHFCDRWPVDLETQHGFLQSLLEFKEMLPRLASAQLPAAQDLLMGLFGESTTRTVIAEFAERAAHASQGGRLRHDARTGAVALGSSGIAGGTVRPSTSRPTPSHTFFGDKGVPQE